MSTSMAPRAPASARGGAVTLTPAAVLAVVGAGALAVIALWWQDTLFVRGLGDWLTNAGRITGLLAGYAVVVLLALMARVPALERGVGTDRLARWHAMGGRYTVSLAVAHTVLIIWGYAVSAHTNVLHESATQLTTYPDVLMATVALGLLVAVGVASARAARRRLRYETWHFIHLYTYLAVALAFAHQFATGADFATDAKARVLWSAMYVLVAGLLCWYRLYIPLRNAMRHQLTVVNVVRESPNVVSIWLGGRNLPSLRAEPGQFFRWRFLTRELWWAANPYSLSAAPRPDLLRITVKASGSHSAALFELQPGTRVLAEGPYGGFIAARRRRHRVLLLAGGVGITPLRALFESIPAAYGDITLLYRINSVQDILLREELDGIARHRGATVHYLAGPPQEGADDPLSAQRLRRLGVPARQVHLESFVF